MSVTLIGTLSPIHLGMLAGHLGVEQLPNVPQVDWEWLRETRSAAGTGIEPHLGQRVTRPACGVGGNSRPGDLACGSVAMSSLSRSDWYL